MLTLCDLQVNNAGVGAVGTVLETSASEMDKLINVNIKGVYHCLQSAIKVMLARGKGGSIINLGKHKRLCLSTSFTRRLIGLPSC